MTRIGFIGLGIMGLPMATNLSRAGYEVVGFDRVQTNIDRLVEIGGVSVGSIAAASEAVDVVITMVPDSPQVQEATLGELGIYSHAKPGTLHIDCSSIRPDIAIQVAEAGRAKGLRVIDAPVSGGEAGAIEATLSIMVGGLARDVSDALPFLNRLGSTVVHVGPNGSGQTVKAANQLIVAGTLELVAEAIVFLEAHEVDMEAAVRVLGGGLAGSAVIARKAAGMLARDFKPGFRVDLHHKDMGIVLTAAREAGVSIPLGAHVAQLLGSLRAQGHGQLDHSSLLLQVEELSGRPINTKGV